MTTVEHAPRALLRRKMIRVALTPHELHALIRLTENRALEAATNPETQDFADFLFRRVAELREAAHHTTATAAR